MFIQTRNMGSTTHQFPEGVYNLCLPLACFAIEPRNFPDMPGVMHVLTWLESKRPTQQSLMEAGELPFLIACRDYFNVRVMVYRLDRAGGTHLSFDTHPTDSNFSAEWGTISPPTAIRRVVFANGHYLRVADSEQDQSVQQALKSFSDHVSPHVNLLWPDLDRELERREDEARKAQEQVDEAKSRELVVALLNEDIREKLEWIDWQVAMAL